MPSTPGEIQEMPPEERPVTAGFAAINYDRSEIVHQNPKPRDLNPLEGRYESHTTYKQRNPILEEHLDLCSAEILHGPLLNLSQNARRLTAIVTPPSKRRKINKVLARKDVSRLKSNQIEDHVSTTASRIFSRQQAYPSGENGPFQNLTITKPCLRPCEPKPDFDFPASDFTTQGDAIQECFKISAPSKQKLAAFRYQDPAQVKTTCNATEKLEPWESNLPLLMSRAQSVPNHPQSYAADEILTLSKDSAAKPRNADVEVLETSVAIGSRDSSGNAYEIQSDRLLAVSNSKQSSHYTGADGREISKSDFNFDMDNERDLRAQRVHASPRNDKLSRQYPSNSFNDEFEDNDLIEALRDNSSDFVISLSNLTSNETIGDKEVPISTSMVGDWPDAEDEIDYVDLNLGERVSDGNGVVLPRKDIIHFSDRASPNIKLRPRHSDPIELLDCISARTQPKIETAPVARPNFPESVRDRSIVLGISTDIVLRTCFRTYEAENFACEATRRGRDAMVELYARVSRSYRDNSAQQFTLKDIWHNRPPYLDASYKRWNEDRLWNSDSGIFLGGPGVGRLCRCVGQMIRVEKKWKLNILSIWETDWSDIEYVVGVVCASSLPHHP